MAPDPKTNPPVRLAAGHAVPPSEDPACSPELICDNSALAAILMAVSSATGTSCFEAVARQAAQTLDVEYAVIAEHFPEQKAARSLAFWAKDRFLGGVEWTLAGTPCQGVVADAEFCHFPDRLAELFPQDTALVDLGVRSYLGAPLLNNDGGVLGHMFIMDSRPMARLPRNLALFRIFAARAGAELMRLRLEREIAATEVRLKDLFDEAPIAYVHEGLDTKFIRANRAAMRILGIKADQVEGTYGRSFVVDSPENQKRLAEAFASVGRGTDTSGVMLELRRQDNGKPIFIEWWSKPDPAGNSTRTMFIDITDKVLLEREQVRLQAQNRYLREEIRSAQNVDSIVGQSKALASVLASVDRVAPTDSTVLIQGETGTGKELIARAIHERSQRRAAPFIKVNCAALPAGLVESEFFGHEKGAFTGAVQSRRGRFELADGGTIFLDEVGEISPEVQVKLLRVLQESEFERVGGSQTIRVNVRVIAATNRDLAAEVKSQRFRADLYYRLSVFPVSVPPLRERAGDVPMLASFFATQLGAAMGKRIEEIDAESMRRLEGYDWPGNIRELRNVLERAVILSEGPLLRLSESDLGGARSGEHAPETARTLADAERDHILAVLRQVNGAIAGPSGAARILGIPPSTLRSRMSRLGISR